MKIAPILVVTAGVAVVATLLIMLASGAGPPQAGLVPPPDSIL